MLWNASAQSKTSMSMLSGWSVAPSSARRSASKSTILGSTMRSWQRTCALTPLRNMFIMSRSFVVPSSRSLVMAATLLTTTLPKRFLTAAQFGYFVTKPLTASRSTSSFTRAAFS